MGGLLDHGAASTFVGPASGVPALDLSLAFPNAATDGANEQTLRMIVKPDLWSNRMRIKLTNVFGTQAITFGVVKVGLNTYVGNLLPGTNTPVTFNGGQTSVTVPAGQEVFSDEVKTKFVTSQDDPVVQGRNLAVSMYVRGTTGPLTFHIAAFQTSYISASRSGDRTADKAAFSFSGRSVDLQNFGPEPVLARGVAGEGSASVRG